MANNYTKVPKSLKRFKVDDVGNLLHASCSAMDVSLDQIGSLAVNQHINDVGKVTKVGDVPDVKSKNSSKDC